MTRRCRIESLGSSLPRPGRIRGGSVRLAVAAGRQCLRASRHDKADIGAVVNAGVHRDRHICEPAMAVFIQHRLGINIEFQGRPTLAFDLINGGCGLLHAAQVVCAMLINGEIEAGLVVASESNDDARPDPRYTAAASGVAALLDVSPRAEQGFGAFAFHARDDLADRYTSVVSLASKRGRILMERRPGLEDAWLGMADDVVSEVLARDGLTRDDIDAVIPAHLSPDFLSRLPRAVGLPASRMRIFPDRLPDTLSTSVLLALDLALADQPPETGRTALLLAFGSGLTAAAAIYHF